MVPLQSTDSYASSMAPRRMWYVFRQLRHFGPFTSSEIKEWISKGYLSNHHHLWRPGYSGWDQIENFDLFRSYVRPQRNEITDQEFAKVTGGKHSSWLRDYDFIEDFPDPLERRDLVSEVITEATATPNVSHLRVLLSKKVLIWSAAAFVSAAGLFTVFAVDTKPTFLRDLPATERTLLLETRSIPYEARRGVAEAVLIDKGDLSLAVATNVPEGNVLKVRLQGIPDTLLGAHRVQVESLHPIRESIFRTDKLALASGKELPTGEYLLQISCTTCPRPQMILFEDGFTVGDTSSSAYKKELKSYHAKVARRARTEIAELGEILATLELQRSQTLKMYEEVQKLSSGKRSAQWRSFSDSWQTFMGEIGAMFAPMNDREFAEELFYDALYTDMRSLAQGISEIHSLQQQILQDSQEAAYSLSVVLVEKNNQVQRQLDSLRARKSLMESQLGAPGSMPSRAGMDASADS